MALAQFLWTRCCDERFFFFRQNAKKKIKIKGIFCLRFLWKKNFNGHKSRGFELVLPDLEALLLWVAK
jgi:hypothetical protein